jgi:uncharacterized OsmC-like protein
MERRPWWRLVRSRGERMCLRPWAARTKRRARTALLLGALAGCAAVLIRDTLAPQLGVRVDSVQAEVKCKADFRGLLGMRGATPDLENLEITIQIHSPEPEEKVQALYRAWLNRCPVYLALTKPLTIKASLAKSTP